MKPQRRFVDLSIYLENDVLSDPPPLAPKITYQKHQDTLHEFMAMLPGTRSEDYPDGDDKNWMKHPMAWIDETKLSVQIDYRPVNTYTMTNEISYIEPKARVY